MSSSSAKGLFSTLTLSTSSAPLGTQPVATVTLPVKDGCSHVLYDTPQIIYEGSNVFVRLIYDHQCYPASASTSNTPLQIDAPGLYQVTLQECAAEYLGDPDPPAPPCTLAEKLPARDHRRGSGACGAGDFRHFGSGDDPRCARRNALQAHSELNARIRGRDQ